MTIGNRCCQLQGKFPQAKTHQFSHCKVQPAQKHKNKKPRGGTMRKHLKFCLLRIPSFRRSRCTPAACHYTTGVIKGPAADCCWRLCHAHLAACKRHRLESDLLQPFSLLKPAIGNLLRTLMRTFFKALVPPF